MDLTKLVGIDLTDHLAAGASDVGQRLTCEVLELRGEIEAAEVREARLKEVNRTFLNELDSIKEKGCLAQAPAKQFDESQQLHVEERHELLGQLEALQRAHDDLTSTLAASNEERRKHAGQLEALNAQCQESSKRVAELETERTSLRSEVDVLAPAYEEAQQALIAAVQRADDAVAKHVVVTAEHQQSATATVSQCEALKNELEEIARHSAQESERLTQQSSALQAELERERCTRESAVAAGQALQQEIETERGRIAAVTSDSATELKALKRTHDDLETALVASTDERRCLHGEVEALTAKIEQRNKHVADLESERNAFQASIGTVTTAEDEAKRMLAAALQRADDVEAKLTVAVAAQDQANADAAAASVTCEGLHAEHSTALADRDQQGQEKLQLAAQEQEQLRQQIKALEERLETEANQAHVSADAATLRSELSSAEAGTQEAQVELEVLRPLRPQLAEREQQLGAELTAARQSHSIEMQSLQDVIRGLELDMARLQKSAAGSGPSPNQVDNDLMTQLCSELNVEKRAVMAKDQAIAAKDQALNQLRSQVKALCGELALEKQMTSTKEEEVAQLSEQMATLNRSTAPTYGGGSIASPNEKGPSGSKSKSGISKFGKLMQGRMEKMTNAVLTTAGQQPKVQDDETQETLRNAADLLEYYQEQVGEAEPTQRNPPPN